MEKIKLGQIGIGHNHGRAKMRTARKFPELFEIVGYSEDNEKWIEQRGWKPEYADLKRMSVEEVIERSDAIFGRKRRMEFDRVREDVRGRGQAYSPG